MPDGPLTGLTLQDLIIDCAERWGVADQTGAIPGIPTSAAVYNLVLRKINAGYQEFLSANPKWTFCEHQVQILGFPNGDGPDNIEGDAGRYRLPSFIGSSPRTDWHFLGDSRPRTTVRNMAVDIVRKRRALYSRRTGIPCEAGVGKIDDAGPPGSPNHGYEVVFWPDPALAYEMEATFRIENHELVDMAERHVAGKAMDRCLIAFINWEWYRDDAEDEQTRARYKAERDEALVKGIRLDNEHRERRRGTLSKERVRPRRPTHAYLGRISVDGVAL